MDTERLAEAGIEPSVGSVGDSYALAETINGLYKAVVIHRRGPWRSFEAVEYGPLEWVDWFDHRRLLKPIGNIPPAEAEERYYAMLDDTAWQPNLTHGASDGPGALHSGFGRSKAEEISTTTRLLRSCALLPKFHDRRPSPAQMKSDRKGG
jgi:hypothetical protein